MLPILKTYSKAAATAVDIINKTNVNINEAGGRVFSYDFTGAKKNLTFLFDVCEQKAVTSKELKLIISDFA